MVVGDQRHAPAALPPGKRPGTRCIGSWVGTQGWFGRVWEISPTPARVDPRTVQAVASRYTDRAIPALVEHSAGCKCSLSLFLHKLMITDDEHLTVLTPSHRYHAARLCAR